MAATLPSPLPPPFTSSQATFSRLHSRVEEVAQGMAAVYGCRVDSVGWSDSPYPPTVNHADMVDVVRGPQPKPCPARKPEPRCCVYYRWPTSSAPPRRRRQQQGWCRPSTWIWPRSLPWRPRTSRSTAKLCPRCSPSSGSATRRSALMRRCTTRTSSGCDGGPLPLPPHAPSSVSARHTLPHPH